MTMENIELESFEQENQCDKLDIDLIEKDAELLNASSPSSPEKQYFYQGEKSAAYSYTPERLIKNRDYRISTPSPTYFSERQSSESPEEIQDIPPNLNLRKSPILRHRLKTLIDSSQLGAEHLKTLLDHRAPEVRVPISIHRPQYLRRCFASKRYTNVDWSETSVTDPLVIANRKTPNDIETPDLGSCDSNSSVSNDEYKPSSNLSKSQPPICLSEELANASSLYTSIGSQHDRVAINEVASILESLETHPEQAECLIDDPFRFCYSRHDRLTRLALSIEEEEQNPNVSIYSKNTEEIFHQLRGKVEKLQNASKDIYKDIGLLRKDYQVENTRVEILEAEATNLRHEINELRYLDDLLNLLRGELARISRRNWPFVIGHSDIPKDEVNLVV